MKFMLYSYEPKGREVIKISKHHPPFDFNEVDGIPDKFFVTLKGAVSIFKMVDQDEFQENRAMLKALMESISYKMTAKDRLDRKISVKKWMTYNQGFIHSEINVYVSRWHYSNLLLFQLKFKLNRN